MKMMSNENMQWLRWTGCREYCMRRSELPSLDHCPSVTALPSLARLLMPVPMAARTTPQTTPKKGRPAALAIPSLGPPSISIPPTVPPPTISTTVPTPADDALQLSSPSGSSSTASDNESPLDGPAFFDAVDGTPGGDNDELGAELAELRRKVKTNLRLRPLRSSQSLAQLAREQAETETETETSSSSEQWQPDSSPSTASTAPSEPPEPELELDSVASPMSSVLDSARSSIYFTPTSEVSLSAFSRTPQSAHFIGSAKIDYSTYHTPRSPSPRPSRGLHPQEVALRLEGYTRPLIIDTRPVPAFLERRLPGALNVAIPTLILKRSRKGGGFPSLELVRQYITTEDGKTGWDELMGPNGSWDGDVIVYDEDMDERQRDNVQSTAWALLPLLQRHLGHGGIDWIRGGWAAILGNSSLRTSLVSGLSYDDVDTDEDQPQPLSLKVPSPKPGPGSNPNSGKRPGGLFQLNTQAAALRSRSMPVLEPESSTSLHPPSPGPLQHQHSHTQELELGVPPRSPAPMMSTLMPPSRNGALNLNLASPAPDQTGFNRPRPPNRKPSLPQLSTGKLSKLDTRSAERLPKLTLKPMPSKSLSLSVPSISTSSAPDASNSASPMSRGNAGLNSLSIPKPPRSPSHLSLVHSNHTSPPPSAISPQGGWSQYSMKSASAEHLPPPTPSFRSGFGGGGGGGSGFPGSEGGFPGGGSSSSNNSYGYPSSPGTPRSGFPHGPPSPMTARPDTATTLSACETEDAYPEFLVSTILPDFLYLGPEMTTEEHVGELERLGVKRILNLAFECDDDLGLRLRERFEKYIRIPMRDTVEEDNITMGVRKACDALGERDHLWKCICSFLIFFGLQMTPACTHLQLTCTARPESPALLQPSWLT
jgi:hypothetical protein